MNRRWIRRRRIGVYLHLPRSPKRKSRSGTSDEEARRAVFMRSSQIRKLILLAVLVALIAIAGSVQIAGFIIEYNWWKEVEQVDAWLSLLWYQIAPAAAGTMIVFIVLWLAHARGLQFAGLRFRDLGLYSRLVPVALLVVAAVLA